MDKSLSDGDNHRVQVLNAELRTASADEGYDDGLYFPKGVTAIDRVCSCCLVPRLPAASSK